jgi:hypothetical protein
VKATGLVVDINAAGISTSVVATFVPPAGFVPLATNERVPPAAAATTGQPLREMPLGVSVNVSTKIPEAGAVNVQ